MVARFEPQKNFKLLKKILFWFEISKIKLRILTDKKNELIDFLAIEESTFIKVFDNQDTNATKIMQSASHHILLSTSEGFANVNLEALSHGCSLVCTSVGDAEIFPKKWCNIVQANTENTLDTLKKISKEFEIKNFNCDAQEKIEYLRQNFAPRIEKDYYA